VFAHPDSRRSTLPIETRSAYARRVQADHAIERAETAERKNKTLEQGLLQKEQEIASLMRRHDALETELERTRKSSVNPMARVF